MFPRYADLFDTVVHLAAEGSSLSLEHQQQLETTYVPCLSTRRLRNIPCWIGLLDDNVNVACLLAAQGVLQLLAEGAQNRHVASTKANADSSRSHCVFTCVLESKGVEDGVTSIRTSCLNVVDLAGESMMRSFVEHEEDHDDVHGSSDTCVYTFCWLQRITSMLLHDSISLDGLVGVAPLHCCL